MGWIKRSNKGKLELTKKTIMNITFNESEKAVEIKDNLKSNQTIILIVLLLNIFNVIVRLIGKDVLRYEFRDYSFALIGLGSLVAIYIQIVKKSTVQKIKLEDIDSFNEKPFFFRKHVFLRLKNGKSRDLGIYKKDHKDLIQIRDLFDELEIPSNRKS